MANTTAVLVVGILISLALLGVLLIGLRSVAASSNRTVS